MQPQEAITRSLQRLRALDLDALARFSLESGLAVNNDPKTNRLAWFVRSAGNEHPTPMREDAVASKA